MDDVQGPITKVKTWPHRAAHCGREEGSAWSPGRELVGASADRARVGRWNPCLAARQRDLWDFLFYLLGKTDTWNLVSCCSGPTTWEVRRVRGLGPPPAHVTPPDDGEPEPRLPPRRGLHRPAIWVLTVPGLMSPLKSKCHLLVAALLSPSPEHVACFPHFPREWSLHEGGPPSLHTGHRPGTAPDTRRAAGRRPARCLCSGLTQDDRAARPRLTRPGASEGSLLGVL